MSENTIPVPVGPTYPDVFALMQGAGFPEEFQTEVRKLVELGAKEVEAARLRSMTPPNCRHCGSQRDPRFSYVIDSAHEISRRAVNQYYCGSRLEFQGKQMTESESKQCVRNQRNQTRKVLLKLAPAYHLAVQRIQQLEAKVKSIESLLVSDSPRK